MRTKPILAVLALVMMTLLAVGAAEPPAASEDGISVYFSPDGGVTDAIIAEILGAKVSVDVQAYSFTNAEIARAVHQAHDRGVKVRVILDKSQRTAAYSSATYLFNATVPVWIDDRHAIAHNKVIIIDGKTIMTGSPNFTNAADDHNAENLLIIKGKDRLVAAYAENFKKHLDHAKAYTGAGR